MLKATYKLSVAGWSVDSSSDPRTELIELDVLQALNVPRDHCRITAYAPEGKSSAGAVQQLAGAAASAVGLAAGAAGGAPPGFSVHVRGQQVAAADAVTIELTAGDVSDTVMTAEVQSVESSFGEITLTGCTGMQRLATTRVNQVYEKQTMDQIVGDLARQAGVQTGTVDTGSRYPYLVAHESKSVLRIVLELARREGMDIFFDSSNKLTVTTFQKTTADHAFRYGAEILALQLDAGDPTADHVLVHGESPASNSGTDTWHWLVQDLSPFRGDKGQGVRLRGVQDGAVRTKDLAASAAGARLGAARDAATAGAVEILGNPKVKVGEAIEIRDAPRPELNGLFKATSVRHVFSKREGYVTVIGFSGQGGAGAAGGGLAGQLGAVAEAL
jgi:hypothetical protein